MKSKLNWRSYCCGNLLNFRSTKEIPESIIINSSEKKLRKRSSFADDHVESENPDSTPSQAAKVKNIQTGYDDNPQIIKSETTDEPKYTQVAILSDGDSFGELALISHKPRAATIRCITDTKFAVLSK